MSTRAYTLRPWTDVVEPHADIRSGDLAMGTYAANLASVALGERDSGERLFRSCRVLRLHLLHRGDGGNPQRRLGRADWAPGDRVLQLRTPFGGGKTHSLLALYHLAKHRDAARDVPELADLPDPGPVRTAVLSGEYLDPQRGREVDGRRITTLWGELAYQLGGWEAYDAAARRRRGGDAAGR